MEMEMEFLRKLPTPQELKEQFPVSTEVVAVKAQRDEAIRNIFEPDVTSEHKTVNHFTALYAIFLREKMTG